VADAPTVRPTARADDRSFVIRTDGAARGNPGPASLGVVLVDASRPDARDPLATPDASISEYLGIQTNNVAEYTGVLRGLALATELGAAEVHLLQDAKLIPLHIQARRLLANLSGWTAAHVPRSQNAAADALANEAIDRVNAGGPPVVVRRPGT
jgi:ribonuclease HI